MNARAVNRCVIGKTRDSSIDHRSEPFGQLHQHAPVVRILDPVESNDQPQPFSDAEINLIVAKQPQQFLIGRVAIVRDHGNGSRYEQ